MLNWDFRKYAVSTKAKRFLDAMCTEPIVRADNLVTDGLLEFAPVLGRVLVLRRKLVYLSAYLRTCRLQDCSTRGRRGRGASYTAFLEPLAPIVSGAGDNVPSREYLARDADRFCLRDLEEAASGELITRLTASFRSGEAHVLSCELCSGKGYICEFCRDPVPIYPFHLETISQCSRCFNVFHKDCSEK